MKWIVIDSLVSPETGTMFSAISSFKNLRLVIWYKSSYLLFPGDIVIPLQNTIEVNNIIQDLHVFKVDIYKLNLWTTLKNNAGCPQNINLSNIAEGFIKQKCDNSSWCLFEECPFVTGKRLSSSSSD